MAARKPWMIWCIRVRRVHSAVDPMDGMCVIFPLSVGKTISPVLLKGDFRIPGTGTSTFGAFWMEMEVLLDMRCTAPTDGHLMRPEDNV